MDAAHTENSDREQSAPPMNGGQSQRPRSRLHTPCFSHPGAQALPSARGSGGGGGGGDDSGGGGGGGGDASRSRLASSRPEAACSMRSLGAATAPPLSGPELGCCFIGLVWSASACSDGLMPLHRMSAHATTTPSLCIGRIGGQ
jgi:hypothetical protein